MTMLSIAVALLLYLAVAGRLWFFVLWLDQGFNVLFGSGWPDEMYSAFAHRKGGTVRAVVNGIFFWQQDHCRDAFYGELQRRQLPPEYRDETAR